jgi:dolichol-phosphate mannosyltransferase
MVAKPNPKISIVIPIYNEAEILPELESRLVGLNPLFQSRFKMAEKDIEFVLVNDGSRDSSLPYLIDLSRRSSQFRIVNLSRNHGHQLAITAGIDQTRGDAIVVMDGDLQDPPEFILDLYSKLLEGFDVVYAKRRKRAGESWFKLLTAMVFYRIMKKLTKFEIPLDTGDFRIMSRRVVQVLSSMKESHRYIRGMISWIGFPQTGIEYERAQREKGNTKFSVFKMLRFAFDGITSFSAVPLRVASISGFLSSLFALLYGIHAIYLKLFTSDTIQGWTSLAILILFLGGVQLFALGIMGEYIGRIHEESKNRPLYIIEKVYEK